MKKMILWATVVALVATAMPALAETLPATFGLRATSQHVWRGAVVADEISVQPFASVDFAGTGFGLDLWSSFAAQSREVWDQSDRVDVTARYHRSLGAVWQPLSFDVGYTEYTFPNLSVGDSHTGEVHLGLAAELPFFSASLTGYRDVNVTERSYIAAGFSPPASFLAGLPIPGLDLHFNVGFSDATDQWGFNDFSTILNWNLPLAGLVQAGPFVGFSYADDSIDPENTNYWGGVSVSISN
jgi:hypothetical protein